MPVEDKKVPYELLIRFGEDGAPLGAHVQFRRIVTLDGERLKDEVLDAEPLGLVEFPTSALLSAATEAALVEINRLNAQIQQLAIEHAETLERLGNTPAAK